MPKIPKDPIGGAVTLTGNRAKQIKTVFRQALGITARHEYLNATLELSTDSKGLKVRCRHGRGAVQFTQPGKYPKQSAFISFESLSKVERAGKAAVRIDLKDGSTRWQEGNVPRSAMFGPHESPDGKWPPLPKEIAENPPHLWSALVKAAQTAAGVSERYVLECIQLRGKNGAIAATDGHQMLWQEGYNFPWEEDVLIYSSRIFGSAQIPKDEPIHIGSTKRRIALGMGPWTVWLPIRDGRFPDVENYIPKGGIPLKLSEGDAKLLLDNLEGLPYNEDDAIYLPITLDLSEKKVVVRATSAEEKHPTELVLVNSKFLGKPSLVSTNRDYLIRALSLGFRDVYVTGSSTFDGYKLACRESSRQYIWMSLRQDTTIPPDPKAHRIQP